MVRARIVAQRQSPQLVKPHIAIVPTVGESSFTAPLIAHGRCTLAIIGFVLMGTIKKSLIGCNITHVILQRDSQVWLTCARSITAAWQSRLRASAHHSR